MSYETKKTKVNELRDLLQMAMDVIPDTLNAYFDDGHTLLDAALAEAREQGRVEAEREAYDFIRANHGRDAAYRYEKNINVDEWE